MVHPLIRYKSFFSIGLIIFSAITALCGVNLIKWQPRFGFVFYSLILSGAECQFSLGKPLFSVLAVFSSLPHLKALQTHVYHSHTPSLSPFSELRCLPGFHSPDSARVHVDEVLLCSCFCCPPHPTPRVNSGCKPGGDPGVRGEGCGTHGLGATDTMAAITPMEEGKKRKQRKLFLPRRTRHFAPDSMRE